MKKQDRFKQFNKIRQSLQESIQTVHVKVKILQEQKEEEAGALIVATIPKTVAVEHKPDDNLDFMIGAVGNPEKIAEAMVRKSKKDIFFAEFCQTLVKELASKMIVEKIDDKIIKAKEQATEFAKATMKKMNEKKSSKN